MTFWQQAFLAVLAAILVGSALYMAVEAVRR